MGQKPELRGASQNAIPYNVGANLKTEMKPKNVKVHCTQKIMF